MALLPLCTWTAHPGAVSGQRAAAHAGCTSISTSQWLLLCCLLRTAALQLPAVLLRACRRADGWVRGLLLGGGHGPVESKQTGAAFSTCAALDWLPACMHTPAGACHQLQGPAQPEVSSRCMHVMHEQACAFMRGDGESPTRSTHPPVAVVGRAAGPVAEGGGWPPLAGPAGSGVSVGEGVQVALPLTVCNMHAVSGCSLRLVRRSSVCAG